MDNRDIYGLPVMIVDDEPNILFSFRMLLKSMGFTDIRCISNSRDVLPTLSKDLPAVVLLDLAMPGVSGFDLLWKIRQLLPVLPIIVMSAADEPDTVNLCLEHGAYAYLRKPVEAEELRDAIAGAVRAGA